MWSVSGLGGATGTRPVSSTNRSLKPVPAVSSDGGGGGGTGRALVPAGAAAAGAAGAAPCAHAVELVASRQAEQRAPAESGMRMEK